MTPREAFAHKLKLRFRLPPNRPTDPELDAITRDAVALASRAGRALTEDEWETIVYAHVKFQGHYIYEGLDFQDLNALFALMQAQAQAQMSARR